MFCMLAYIPSSQKEKLFKERSKLSEIQKQKYTMSVGAPSQPLPQKVVAATFPRSTLRRWPTGYLPTATAARFLRPGGIPLAHVCEFRNELGTSHKMLKELTTDKMVWLRSVFEDYVGTHPEEARVIMKLSMRSRLHRQDDLEKAFQLSWLKEPYRFTPFAVGQEIAMRPIEKAREKSKEGRTDPTVLFEDFPSLHRVLNTSYYGFTPLSYFLHACGDEIWWTRESVAEIASYLGSRLRDLGGHPQPVLTTFSNGRLAHFLSSVVDVPVMAWSQPGRKSRTKGLPTIVTDPSWDMMYKVVPGTLTDALVQVNPQIVIVEPHNDRDFMAEIHGYPSVKEVIFLGPVDSPGMCSFSFPWLSFGALPGSSTYYVYDENLQMNVAMNNGRHPMDPPYAMQGYETTPLYIDEISSRLLGRNDGDEYHSSMRCRVHRRV